MKRLILLTTIGIGIALALFLLNPQPDTTSAQPGAITLGPRPVSAAANGLNDVGISAYIKANETINLDDLNGTFRTIEDKTDTYIVGSVAVPDYSESFDTHVYVSVDGWLLAYYSDDTDASKIVDWKAYLNAGGVSITTLLEKVLRKVTSDAAVAFETPTYYDFRYPGATHMMFIADFTGGNQNDEFRVELPSEYTYYETSWGIYVTSSCCAAHWMINGSNIMNSGTNLGGIVFGDVTMSTDTEHTIGLDYPGGLVIIYREQ